jgi:ElaB/YqjD/DUF883 family membrane-anchored ribosome-binding protein
MTTETKNQQGIDESTNSAATVAQKADQAVRDTAQKYISRTGIKVDLEQIENTIRANPLPSLAIAAATGFVVGGGTATRAGLALLALFSRKVARETATNLITGMIRTSHH